ncbi:MAG: BMP family ABC transporter substrate-binding protein [Anaerolineae bacterium]|nr:BMP family ABC transporter substrate-binding protein [Anaerolineae bacterium]
MKKRAAYLTGILLSLLVAVACYAPEPTVTPVVEEVDTEFVFGMVLVGPKDDHGWSEAHYNGGKYIEEHIADSRMLLMESLNPDAQPDKALGDVVDDMVAEGADMIFVTSDDFSADTTFTASRYPELPIVHVSGDHALRADAPPNVGNYFARMVYGKMIAGCTSALVTETGHIAYVGPLINGETRRLANAAFLGARYCYEEYRDQPPESLQFDVEWVGFWFHIPGVTRDPAEITNELIDRGADVIMSGIDTPEPLQVVATRAAEGHTVWALPYDYEDACAPAPQVCLGVPYFNWGPGYLRLAEEVISGEWQPTWEWAAPYWQDINDPGRSPVGFYRGTVLTAEQGTTLDAFIRGLGNGSIVLFRGPLNYHNGPFLREGEVATDEQIWDSPQLLEGMEGLSD